VLTCRVQHRIAFVEGSCSHPPCKRPCDSRFGNTLHTGCSIYIQYFGGIALFAPETGLSTDRQTVHPVRLVCSQPRSCCRRPLSAASTRPRRLRSRGRCWFFLSSAKTLIARPTGHTYVLTWAVPLQCHYSDRHATRAWPGAACDPCWVRGPWQLRCRLACPLPSSAVAPNSAAAFGLLPAHGLSRANPCEPRAKYVCQGRCRRVGALALEFFAIVVWSTTHVFTFCIRGLLATTKPTIPQSPMRASPSVRLATPPPLRVSNPLLPALGSAHLCSASSPSVWCSARQNSVCKRYSQDEVLYVRRILESPQHSSHSTQQLQPCPCFTHVRSTIRTQERRIRCSPVASDRAILCRVTLPPKLHRDNHLPSTTPQARARPLVARLCSLGDDARVNGQSMGRHLPPGERSHRSSAWRSCRLPVCLPLYCT